MDSKEITHTTRRKVHNDIIKTKKTKTQKLEKNIKVERWIEEMVQLRLEMQIDKLHKNIQFFKQENEYIRRLSEKCRCLSDDIKGLQQLLPTRETYTHGERFRACSCFSVSFNSAYRGTCATDSYFQDSRQRSSTCKQNITMNTE